jgi:hypothetical protein
LQRKISRKKTYFCIYKGTVCESLSTAKSSANRSQSGSDSDSHKLATGNRFYAIDGKALADKWRKKLSVSVVNQLSSNSDITNTNDNLLDCEAAATINASSDSPNAQFHHYPVNTDGTVEMPMACSLSTISKGDEIFIKYTVR